MTPEALLAHPDIARLAAALRDRPGRAIEPEPPARLAAIALLIRAGAGGEPELLLIKRAELDRDPWSGHVACPGGRMEPGDPDLRVTAERETREETSIDLAVAGRLLGTLDDVSPGTPVLPPIVVRPFVYAVRAEVAVVPTHEVAAAFWVPVSLLRERGSWHTGTVQVRGVAREVIVFTHGEYTVWGLTERVLQQFIERMAPG